MDINVIKNLGAPFPFESVEAKIQVASKDNSGKGMAVFYLDSRAIQNRLDEVLGYFNWKNQYLTWQNNAQLCGIAIYNAERNEWVAKFDGAECSKVEPVKGGLSDSFKRAACMWGIGRYLYEIDGVWVDVEQRGQSTYIKNDQQGKLRVAYDAAVKRIFGTIASQQASGSNTAGAGSSANRNQSANVLQDQQPPTTLPPQNQNNTQPPSTPKNANAGQQPPAQQASDNEQRSKGNTLSVRDFKVHSMKPAGQKSKLLELCSHDGKITPAYISANEQALAVGVNLRNVNIEEKTGAHGKYNLLISYEVAA